MRQADMFLHIHNTHTNTQQIKKPWRQNYSGEQLLATKSFTQLQGPYSSPKEQVDTSYLSNSTYKGAISFHPLDPNLSD